MKKHICLLVLLFLSIRLCVANLSSMHMAMAAGKTWQVPQDYLTIDAAIIAANSGDTINVAGGTFDGFLVDKSLSIIGQPGLTKINGYVSVEASNSKITGMTISRNIAINKDYCEITYNNVSGSIGPSPSFFNHCTISDNTAASLVIVENDNSAARNNLGSLDLSGDRNTITANTISITSRTAGLDLEGNLNVISNNQITADKGIFSVSGEQNQVTGNKITSRFICVEFGQDAGNNTVLNNLLESSSGDGVHIDGWGKGNLITDNSVKATKNGIYVQDKDTIINNYVENGSVGISGCIKVLGNTVKHCGTGIIVGSTATILSNNLIENTVQAISYNQNSVWSENGKGNYWSDWTSPDSNNDGIVDNPYVISGSGRSLDRYPSVSPVSWSPTSTPSPTPSPTLTPTLNPTPTQRVTPTPTPILTATPSLNPQPVQFFPLEVLYTIVGIAVIIIIVAGIATTLVKKNNRKRSIKTKQVEK